MVSGMMSPDHHLLLQKVKRKAGMWAMMSSARAVLQNLNAGRSLSYVFVLRILIMITQVYML